MQFISERIRFILYWLRYLNDFLYDHIRFVKYSNTEYTYIRNTDKLVAKIISLYHVIEKGLSIDRPRLRFGVPRIKMLMRYIAIYSGRVDRGNWDIQVVSSLKVLREYSKFNKDRGADSLLVDEFLKDYSDVLEVEHIKGGTKALDLDEFFSQEAPLFDTVVSLRSSVRNFGVGEVALADVHSAIALAQQSPSTCNRQSSRVLITKDRIQIDELLALQGGANGFSEQINCLLVICSDLSCYQGPGDRTSGIIDGSLFGMSFLHAATRYKIASIPLNWSKNYKDDIKLRAMISFPDSYAVLFFVGLGVFKNNVRVPCSTKNSTHEICMNIEVI
jgi:nitroreductase|tara:strand:- start:1586 stop:2581 length:996 start_codon:yes stop_codon:yes gene_type:complete